MERNIHPTRALPMKLKKPTLESVARDPATSRAVVTNAWHHSSGRPASRRIPTKRIAERGVASAGLTIHGHPVATAGPTW